MYNNKLVAAIKVNDKVLREFEDQVFLPFNSTYSIFIKNKNSVRASVKIEIDGIDVTQGVSLVVDPNDEIELERFIKNGNLDQGNRFKFIKRTSAIEQHRGVKLEDGLVRIEFQFEKISQPVYPNGPWYHPPLYQFPYQPNPNPNFPSPLKTWCQSTIRPRFLASNNVGYHSNCSEVGITAPGSISDQEFNMISTFPLESQRHVIVMRLLGQHQGKSVSKTVTTRSRTECVICGHISKTTSAKFCSRCGTSLQIIY